MVTTTMTPAISAIGSQSHWYLPRGSGPRSSHHIAGAAGMLKRWKHSKPQGLPRQRTKAVLPKSQVVVSVVSHGRWEIAASGLGRNDWRAARVQAARMTAAWNQM